MTNPIHSVHRFMRLAGQLEDPDRTWRTLNQYINRVYEEVYETEAAMCEHDIEEIIDGLIDTAYTALGACIWLVGKQHTIEAWDTVADANLAKVDGRHGPTVRDKYGKVQKPSGWQRPSHHHITQHILKEDPLV